MRRPWPSTSWAAVLALTRGIAAGAAGIREGRWRLDLYTYDLVGPELPGRTCGVIGFGGWDVPSRRSRVASACACWSYDPYVDPDVIRAAGAEPASLDRVLSEARDRGDGGAADRGNAGDDRGARVGAAAP